MARIRRQLLVFAAALVAAVSLAVGVGCGGSDKPEITVSAASSLTEAFGAYGEEFDPATSHFSFAGSDDLAAQIRQGARPDVYAAAETDLPNQLFHEGLLEHPVVFATNTLVIAVPADSKVHSLGDLAQPGTSVVIGSPDVPAGSYAREVLDGDGAEGQKILGNVRSSEPDVKGVIGKLTEGAADAGFVYITDVMAAGSSLKAVAIPKQLAPAVAYAAAVVKDAPHPDQAKDFVAGLLHGKGAAELRSSGFGPPPSP